MKVKKKWKKYVHQIALACLLICCIATCVPQTVKAEIQSDQRQSGTEFKREIYDNSSGKTYIDKYMVSDNSKPCYLFFYTNSSGFVSCEVISLGKFNLTREDYYVGDEKNKKIGDVRSASVYTCMHGSSFYHETVSTFCGDTDWKTIKSSYYRVTYESMESAKKKDPERYKNVICFMYELLSNEQIPEYIECVTGDDSEGGVNNPIEDPEIGTIEISGKAYAQDATANSDNIDEQFYTKWNWKNKTSTGFSLTKNKYHMTRIQVMVESRCLVYSDLKHKTVKEKFENYGERNKLKNGILPTDKPHTIYLKDVMSALPKTKGEFHNVLFCGYNFKYYWRVMCNDSPTGTGKWYCGGWRAVDLNQDSNKSKDINDTNNGHFDDDGNWVKDEDDGHNNTTDFSDDISGQNPDDANDTITNPKKDKADKFGWDDFKNLINECKQVPDLIKSVFSFLPDWVLVFIAIGFGIWIFVLIKRAIV